MLTVVLSTLIASVPGQAVTRPEPAAIVLPDLVGRHNPPNRAEPWSFPPPRDTDR